MVKNKLIGSIYVNILKNENGEVKFAVYFVDNL